MQEAFGGTFMLKLFMVFFIIYVFFIGVALNFAKIYRIKNNVINILEQYQYSGDIKADTNGEIIRGKLSQYLDKVPYQFEPSDSNKELCYSKADSNKIDDELFGTYGVCVIQKGDTDKHYYGVTVFHIIEFPLFELKIPITASGETIVIDT